METQLPPALFKPTSGPAVVSALLRRASISPLVRQVVGSNFNAAVERLDGFWDASRLRRFVTTALDGEQLIVVSNREPCSHERIDGRVQLIQPAGGLITAVEPVVGACAGTWIAHGSGNADREFVDDGDVWQAPAERGAYRIRRLWLSNEEQRGHGDGFSNSGLWPLCHMAHVRPLFTERDWAQYRAVNRRFADAVVEEARQPDPVVLVHDYHLALVPALVRKHLPHATIVSFWHVPWSHPDQMGICPWLPEIVRGLLGSDIVGFQTPEHVRHFAAAVDHDARPAPDQGGHEIVRHGHCTRVRDYPISIAWPTAPEVAAWPSVARCRLDAALRFALPADGRLIVGIDRFDYTKGLLERLRAVEQLLVSYPQWRGRIRYVQVAAPTRTALAEYAGIRMQVWAEVERINARFAASGPDPILLLDAHHDHAAVNALYRAADVCLVTSLHDGMNLVCKEFIAARDDEQGVLVLSRFAGAAHELTQASIVNPYHSAEVAEAIHRGLAMPPHEQRRRMRSLRATVRENNAYRWAASMLIDAAALRSASSTRSAETPDSVAMSALA